jgi:hypothetical protein
MLFEKIVTIYSKQLLLRPSAFKILLPASFVSTFAVVSFLFVFTLPHNQPAAAANNSHYLFLPYITRNAFAESIWRPTPGTSWQIQFSGQIDTSLDVQVYDLDMVDTPRSTIDQLHTDGHTVMCYFSAGSWEQWRSDADDFPDSVLGDDLDGWPGEKWLDIRRLDLLGPIMSARLDTAVQKSCDGVDPDNVDGYANNTGFNLSYQDQIAYNTWLADQAHARGLAIGLKNDLDQIADLLPYFDWALNEQCFQYNECDLLLPFVTANKPVFGIEYNSDMSSFCPLANQMNFDFLKKNWDLDAWRIACR